MAKKKSEFQPDPWTYAYWRFAGEIDCGRLADLAEKYRWARLVKLFACDLGGNCYVYIGDLPRRDGEPPAREAVEAAVSRSVGHVLAGDGAPSFEIVGGIGTREDPILIRLGKIGGAT